MGDPELPSRIVAAVTGIAGDDFEQHAARTCNLQRAILIREGRKVPEADYPLEINFTEPLGTGTQLVRAMMVPGPGDEIIDTTGYILDRQKFTGILKEYYSLRGWDEETGLPLADTLSALGLGDLTPGS